VFWVGLAALRASELVLDTIGQTLGAKDGLTEHVAERELLLLLDNLEQVIDAAPELASLVEACPNLHLLVTSRELLRVRGEVEYPVPPLDAPEAVTLFSERARLGRDETVAELCRRLDNLPLAVELAAARTSVLTPEQILDRLAQRLDLLKGGRDAETRQQTLRATIEWSHDLLGDQEKTLFARLAVFQGGCTLDGAEEVADAGLDTLQSLVDKNLLRHTGGRFWMLETIREYAVEQLEASGEADKQRRRFADHYLALAEDAYTNEFSEDRGSLDRLESEHDNLRTVLAWLAEGGETQQVLQLAGALANFWGMRGFVSEGFRHLEFALAADEAPTGARARAANAAADLGGLGRGDPDTAEHWAQQGLELHRRLGDRWGEAQALFTLGHAACDRHDFARAREQAEASRRLFEDLGDEPWAAAATWLLGWAHTGVGEWARGREFYEDALQRARSLDTSGLRSLVLYSLSGRLVEEGRPTEALALVQEAYEVDRSNGDRWRMSLTACRLGSVLVALGRPADAALCHSAGLAALEEMGGVPLHRAEEDEGTLARLREALGEERLEAQRQRARKLSLEGAVEAALAEPPSIASTV
jgi:predicted ATPase